jgi:class 3 adenylate cyclase
VSDAGPGTYLLIGVTVVELIALIVLAVLLVRARRTADDLREQLARPVRTGPRSAAGRAVKAMVETAVRMREQGVGGLLMSSLEDLTRWATEDRAAIDSVASADGTVTIFFSDIENSTALNERLGDARWVRLLDAHDSLVRRMVDKHGGHVVKTQGDGFMVVFGDAAAGARAAVDIQRSLGQGRNRSLRRMQVKIRIGLHVGTAVARDGDYFGRNVALAARVAAEAAGDQILVSDAVRAALEDCDEFVLEPRGDTELRGLADRHALWELSWSDARP